MTTIKDRCEEINKLNAEIQILSEYPPDQSKNDRTKEIIVRIQQILSILWVQTIEFNKE